MHLKFRNVNDALCRLLKIFSGDDVGTQSSSVIRTHSRNGPVLLIEEPVLISYARPTERVLFNDVRDANPFFHLYESLWMLAGRNDVAPLAYYNSKIKDFSDDGVTLNGAYGHRWRHREVFTSREMTPEELSRYGQCGGTVEGHKNLDQLDWVVRHLTAFPNSRRAVINMWTVEDDLAKSGPVRFRCHGCNGTGYHRYPDFKDGSSNYSDSAACGFCKGLAWVYCPTCEGVWDDAKAASLDEAPPPARCPNCAGNPQQPCTYHGGSRDLCCNLEVMLSLRALNQPDFSKPLYDPEWGPLPSEKRVLDITVTNRSNDLLWGMLGANYCHFSFLQEYLAARLGVGVGHYHHFTNNLHVYGARPDWKPRELLAEYDKPSDVNYSWYSSPTRNATLVPLVKDPARFEQELPLVVEAFSGPTAPAEVAVKEPFLRHVAAPALQAYFMYRTLYSPALALETCSNIQSPDWREACRGWITRRVERKAQVISE